MIPFRPLSVRHGARLAILPLMTCMLLISTANAAEADNSTYQKERAACLQGASHQDRQTCLREAAAARSEARRGNLTESDRYAANASQRCQVLPPADREDCMRRVRGEGSVSGSVEQGGIYRETRRTVIVEPSQSQTPSPVYAPVPARPQPPMPPR